MSEIPNQPARHGIGELHGVAFEVVAWDGAHADAALSVACMFEREAAGATLQGGLLHLDQALDGALTALRRSGGFRAEPMETLLITTPPAGIRAKTVMIIGLGVPESVTTEDLERAIRVTMREAIRLDASSVAFAPSLLDSGLVDGLSGDGALAMLRGAFDALAAEHRLASLGLTTAAKIKRWSFDAGPTHIDSVGAEFSAAFARLTGS